MIGARPRTSTAGQPRRRLVVAVPLILLLAVSLRVLERNPAVAQTAQVTSWRVTTDPGVDPTADVWRDIPAVEVPLSEGFALDLPAMRAAIRARRPNLIFLASPNNPTGNAFSDEDLGAVVDAAPDALVVIDEAYAPFAGRSLGGWVRRHDNVAVLGTLSKIGLAGLRLGWLRARPEIVQEVEKARPPYNLATPTQVAAELLLREHGPALDAQVARIVDERARLVAALGERRGLRAFPTAANFVLVEVEEAGAVHAALLERGVQVRRFATLPRLARHLRITVGTPEEDDALLAALDALGIPG